MKALRITAVLFSVIGLFFLLRRIDFAYQIIPINTAGPETGLIEIAVDAIFGVGATLFALVLAFTQLLHSNSNKALSTRLPKIVIAWCCLLLLGFIGFFFL